MKSFNYCDEAYNIQINNSDLLRTRGSKNSRKELIIIGVKNEDELWESRVQLMRDGYTVREFDNNGTGILAEGETITVVTTSEVVQVRGATEQFKKASFKGVKVYGTIGLGRISTDIEIDELWGMSENTFCKRDLNRLIIGKVSNRLVSLLTDCKVGELVIRCDSSDKPLLTNCDVKSMTVERSIIGKESISDSWVGSCRISECAFRNYELSIFKSCVCELEMVDCIDRKDTRELNKGKLRLYKGCVGDLRVCNTTKNIKFINEDTALSGSCSDGRNLPLEVCNLIREIPDCRVLIRKMGTGKVFIGDRENTVYSDDYIKVIRAYEDVVVIDTKCKIRTISLRGMNIEYADRDMVDSTVKLSDYIFYTAELSELYYKSMMYIEPRYRSLAIRYYIGKLTIKSRTLIEDDECAEINLDNCELNEGVRGAGIDNIVHAKKVSMRNTDFQNIDKYLLRGMDVDRVEISDLVLDKKFKFKLLDTGWYTKVISIRNIRAKEEFTLSRFAWLKTENLLIDSCELNVETSVDCSEPDELYVEKLYIMNSNVSESFVKALFKLGNFREIYTDNGVVKEVCRRRHIRCETLEI